ncbi:hypothetical protein [Dysgonomonas sp. 511]|uniref:hypothetical protein n=1 Tax=Dysgonomonas sp. 511 TaxID=2302930 RepID=UPI0013D4F79D|nr:hypothetical protein [Dysgonomonas sp. 511]NDV79476.1 hypothetical protein [Dysgonomonas sp. 511]
MNLLTRLFLLSGFLFFFQYLSGQTTITENIKNAQAVFARLDAQNEYKDDLNHVDMNRLPSGFNATVNNMDVTIAVSGAEFYPEYTALEAFLRIKIPGEKGRTLFFGAKDIKLSHDGDIIGDAKLNLLQDIEIPVSGGNLLFRLKGDFDRETGQSRNLTYASIDCKGLKALGLTAEIEISPKLCYPVNAKGDSIPNKKVIGRFQTEIEDWNDIVASVSFPSFSIKGLKDFIWTLEDAVFDFSDLKNAQSFSFPQGYQQYLIPGNENLWQGIYIGNLSVTLPPQFAKNGDRRVTISARDMLIDDNGITGKIGATNILSINEGNASGWAFSVDYFGLELMANHLEGAEFNGTLALPISEKTRLKYDGLITADDKYLLRIGSLDSLSFDMLHAKAEIFPNSYVEFKVDKGKFRPEAMLHGRMGIELALNKGGEKSTKFKGIEFRSLHLKTQNPYLSVEYLGYKGEVKLKNFPVSLKDIALTTRGTEAALNFDIDLTLSDGAFSGSTRLAIVGKMEDGQLHKWKYDHLEINKIKIDATLAETFNLKGELSIMDDNPTYGDAISGEIDVKFLPKSPLSGLGLKARCMFGYSDFRYWFVDGVATLPETGIPIAPGINLSGFGGGITYHMRPEGIQGNGDNALSATATNYIPDKDSPLGIKAATAFAIPKKELIHAEACFELAFNSKCGLSYAGFYSYAQVLSVIPDIKDFKRIAKERLSSYVKKELEFTGGKEGLTNSLRKLKQFDPNEAAMILLSSDNIGKLGKSGFSAALGIQFNFSELSFHATYDLYVNVLGGLIRGTASNNRAGYSVLHIDPKDWYMHMGTPTDRIGLKMGITGIYTVQTESYLMVGTKVPAAPEVPQQVASILGYSPDDLNYMKDLNMLAAGKGVAFGSRKIYKTGDLTFLILYANYQAGLGYDIMLKDYSDAQCKGRSGAIGINGWYANGQAYAYLQGELGVKVNLWFMKAKIPIFSADIAALMQAKLPNPISFKAYLAVRAKVLGFIKVNCRFKLSIGEECELIIPGGSPLDMMMISDLSPSDKDDNISVFTAPQATFNMAIGKAFTVQDDEGEKTFRIGLKDFVLNDGTQDIVGELKWNKDKDVASFYSHEILPPNTEVKATVRVIFEEKKNGRWQQVYTAGQEAIESKEVIFATSDAPEDIPLQNIVYSYPVVGQKYYLKDEANTGYIQLEYGQTYLFPEEFKNLIVFEDAMGNKQSVDFRYNEARKRIDYTLPRIDNSSAYSVNIVSLSKEDSATTATQTDRSILDDEEEGNIDVETRQAVAQVRTDVGKTLLTYDFATSAYSTLKEKIENIHKTRPSATIVTSDILMFGYETQGMEPFDLAELTGTEQSDSKPLVDVSATLDDQYYTQKIYPLMYQNYPVDNIISVKRANAEEIGVPPVKALPIRSQYLTQIENNEYRGYVTQYFPYYYNLPAVYKEDFIDLQHQVINTMLGKGGATFNHYVKATFPFITPETYKIKLQYMMPGGIKGTSATFDYYNFVK